jgi:hypothetical protein
VEAGVPAAAIEAIRIVNWTLLIGSTVVAAVISGLVSLASAMMTLKTASRRAGVDEKIAQARREVDQQIAQARGAVDRELAAIKAQYDKELAEQKARLDNRAVYAAERVVHELLMHPQWKQRTFEAIQRRLDGFEGMELKRILVQAGAVRFTRTGKEYWGLIERNRDALEAGG